MFASRRESDLRDGIAGHNSVYAIEQTAQTCSRKFVLSPPPPPHRSARASASHSSHPLHRLQPMRRSVGGPLALIIFISALLLSPSLAQPTCTSGSPPACCFPAPSGNFYDLTQAYTSARIFDAPLVRPARPYLARAQSTPQTTCHPRLRTVRALLPSAHSLLSHADDSVALLASSHAVSVCESVLTLA